MRSDKPSLELFLRPADAEGQSLARGLGAGALAEAGVVGAASADGAHPERYLDPAGEPNSLRDQGWGVIAPRGEDGDRLLARTRALLDKRAADQDAEVPVYRVPPDMTAVQAVTWLDRKLVGNALHDDIPGYLLVLGRPDQVSFELQQVLASAYSVGRVGFDAAAGPEAYEAYVDKLLRSERAPARGSARAVYFTARDGTPATEIGHRLLMQPCIADAEQQRAAGRFAASEIAVLEEEDPARATDRLLAAAAAPGVLFSCSHGAGAPRQGWASPDQRRALQGALCLGRGQRLEAQTLAQAPFVPGGVWLMFACFGAGTPRHSAYHTWLSRLQAHGEHDADLASLLTSLPGEDEPPFIAALPQAALANPDGPLAIIGHLDLAWSYGFVDIDKASRGERHRRFHELVAQLVRGSRVGLALGGSLARARNQVEHELVVAAAEEARAGQGAPGARGGGVAGEADAEREPQVRLGHRWMVLQDLDGYIALGDPAARLAVAATTARATHEAAAAAGGARLDGPGGWAEVTPRDIAARPDGLGEVTTRDATARSASSSASFPAMPPVVIVDPVIVQGDSATIQADPAIVQGDSATIQADIQAAPAIIQAAVHDLIAGRSTLADLAVRCGVSPATVDEWRQVYTDAGLRAVSALIAKPRGS